MEENNKCPKCGNEVLDDWEECPYCRNKLVNTKKDEKQKRDLKEEDKSVNTLVIENTTALKFIIFSILGVVAGGLLFLFFLIEKIRNYMPMRILVIVAAIVVIGLSLGALTFYSIRYVSTKNQIKEKQNNTQQSKS